MSIHPIILAHKNHIHLLGNTDLRHFDFQNYLGDPEILEGSSNLSSLNSSLNGGIPLLPFGLGDGAIVGNTVGFFLVR